MDGIAGSELNRLQVAKLELVGNKWIELGQANLDSLYILNDPWVEDEAFGATVANTEENGWYSFYFGWKANFYTSATPAISNTVFDQIKMIQTGSGWLKLVQNCSSWLRLLQSGSL